MWSLASSQGTGRLRCETHGLCWSSRCWPCTASTCAAVAVGPGKRVRVEGLSIGFGGVGLGQGVAAEGHRCVAMFAWGGPLAILRPFVWQLGGTGYHLPRPLVQATVNDQKLTDPTPSVAWTRVLLTRCTVRGTCPKPWCTVLKTKGQNMLQRPCKIRDVKKKLTGPMPSVAWT